MTTYSLIVENKSILTGSICVYQRDPQQRINRNLYSLAWFSKMCHPNTTVEFSWSIDYCFNWAETGALRPGVLFSASESLAADPSLVDATNTIAFNYSSGAFRFVQAKEITDPGMLRIITDNTIPNKKASIGIGMSRSARLCHGRQSQPELFVHPASPVLCRLRILPPGRGH